MAKVSVHIVSWNSAKHLKDAMESLRAQTFQDFGLIVVDNASNDESVSLVREHFPEATLLRNPKNQGFSRGHNQAIALARRTGARYVLVMNPDIILDPGFLARLVAAADGRLEIGSIGGKLLRATPRATENDEPKKTDVIDSCGLAVRRTRRIVDRGSGEVDKGQYDTVSEVFGVSGALALYRLEALDALEAATGECFDEDMFAYKEDVDVAWRLRLLGWKAAYVPTALAHHYRGVGGAAVAGPWRAFVARYRRSTMLKRLSTRNHLLTIVKNEDWSSGLMHLPLIATYEIAKLVESLVFSQSVLPAYWQALALLPKMLSKRRRMTRARVAKPADIRKWFR